MLCTIYAARDLKGLPGVKTREFTFRCAGSNVRLYLFLVYAHCISYPNPRYSQLDGAATAEQPLDEWLLGLSWHHYGKRVFTVCPIVYHVLSIGHTAKNTKSYFIVCFFLAHAVCFFHTPKTYFAMCFI